MRELGGTEMMNRITRRSRPRGSSDALDKSNAGPHCSDRLCFHNSRSF